VQPKSATEMADDQWIRILKNKLIELKEIKKTGHCDCVAERVVYSYVYKYSYSVMLCLQNDFYNVIF
jgi:hypothetical protein